MLISNHTIKMEEEKNKYEQAVLQLKGKYEREIDFTNKKYQTMAVSKMKQ